ncbi:arginase [Caulobacter sp. Root1455]|uniref:arginase family protein n=1 Tax=Caulobacter sp. Root1455 TaxID=1736465 RepID=UPI0006F98CD8|nr:arginase family protein [Caulobacter sp. Root1455]KQZ04024.1 arginase [Caulobacter sp. Root1455]
MTALALTVFQGRAGDRNPRGAAGALAVGAALEARLDLRAERVGAPAPPLAAGWSEELEAARPGLEALAARLDAVLADGKASLVTQGRCATSIAALPVVLRHHPDALIVWFDAHGDCNQPAQSTTGYLGGMVLTGAAGVWDTGLGRGLDLTDVVLVGARDLDPCEAALVAAGGPRLVAAGSGIGPRLAAAIGDRPVYVHLDCDVLEPGLVPTEYSVEDGLSFDDLREACAVLAGNQVIGLEIAEFEDVFVRTGAPGDVGALLDALAPLLDRLAA